MVQYTRFPSRCPYSHQLCTAELLQEETAGGEPASHTNNASPSLERVQTGKKRGRPSKAQLSMETPSKDAAAEAAQQKEASRRSVRKHTKRGSDGQFYGLDSKRADGSTDLQQEKPSAKKSSHVQGKLHEQEEPCKAYSAHAVDSSQPKFGEDSTNDRLGAAPEATLRSGTTGLVEGEKGAARSDNNTVQQSLTGEQTAAASPATPPKSLRQNDGVLSPGKAYQAGPSNTSTETCINYLAYMFAVFDCKAYCSSS